MISTISEKTSMHSSRKFTDKLYQDHKVQEMKKQILKRNASIELEA